MYGEVIMLFSIMLTANDKLISSTKWEVMVDGSD